MAVYKLESEKITALNRTTFSSVNLSERGDLQRLLRDQIELISPDTLVISEEFSEWEDSRRRIDLLAVDKNANLVVIELKRTEDGGHMELQSLRYAAMVSALSFDKVVDIFEAYSQQRGHSLDARQTILDFLEWDDTSGNVFGQDVRIVLASANFSRELTTSVLWLCEKNIDIRCVRISPYEHSGDVFLDVQQVIPIPEAQDYQVQLREKRSVQSSRAWQARTDSEIWQDFTAKLNEEDLELVRHLVDWMTPFVDEVFPTKNGFAQTSKINGVKYYFFKIGVDGALRIWFQYFAGKAPFSDQDVRAELIERFRSVANLEMSEDQLTRRPNITLASLRDEKALATFKQHMEWVFQQTLDQADHGDAFAG